MRAGWAGGCAVGEHGRFPGFLLRRVGGRVAERIRNLRAAPHGCEHRVNTGEHVSRSRIRAAIPASPMPAPQPAYDFLPLAAIARVSIRRRPSRGGAAIVVVGRAVRRGARGRSAYPWRLAAAALLLSTGYVGAQHGPNRPFSCWPSSSCGSTLARGRDAARRTVRRPERDRTRRGLPVTLAVLAYVPRARVPAAATAAASLAGFGARGRRAGGRFCSTRFTSFRHKPRRKSISRSNTVSRTRSRIWALRRARRARPARCRTFCLLALGLWLAPRVARNAGRRELLVFIPALACVIGGPYVHQEELCFALPALLVLAVYARGPARTAFAVALCVLAVPWIAVWGLKQLFLAALFCCALILWRLRIPPVPAWTALLVIALTIYAFELHPPHLPVPSAPARSFAATELVQDEWGVYAEQRSTPDPLWFAIKLPAWGALLAGFAFAARVALLESHSTSARI